MVHCSIRENTGPVSMLLQQDVCACVGHCSKLCRKFVALLCVKMYVTCVNTGGNAGGWKILCGCLVLLGSEDWNILLPAKFRTKSFNSRVIHSHELLFLTIQVKILELQGHSSQ